MRETGRWNFDTNTANLSYSNEHYVEYTINTDEKIVGIIGYQWDSTYCAYGFYNENNILISKCNLPNGTNILTLYKIPVPDGATKIIVNLGSAGLTHPRGLYAFTSLQSKLYDLLNKPDKPGFIWASKFDETSVKSASNPMIDKQSKVLHYANNYLYAGGDGNMNIAKIPIENNQFEQYTSILSSKSGYATRGMDSKGNFLFVPLRENTSGFTTNESHPVGGYLQIINTTNETVVETIEYPKNPITISSSTYYFGKCQSAKVYDNYLIVCKQFGGSDIYDITTPENPTLIYNYDTRQLAIDQSRITPTTSRIGSAEYQQADVFDVNGNLYLCTTGYDRDLLQIFDMSAILNDLPVDTIHIAIENDVSPYAPIFTQHIRELWNPDHNLSINTPYIHACDLVCNYPYIYCTIGAYSSHVSDFDNTMQGVAVVDVSNLSNIKTTLYPIPEIDRVNYFIGEPGPSVIKKSGKRLLLQNFSKGLIVYSLNHDPSSPIYEGLIPTKGETCGIETTEDGIIFTGSGKIDSSSYVPAPIELFR